MSDMYVRRANHFLSWKEVGNGTSLPVLCGWLPAVKYSPEGAEEEKKTDGFLRQLQHIPRRVLKGCRPILAMRCCISC